METHLQYLQNAAKALIEHKYGEGSYDPNSPSGVKLSQNDPLSGPYKVDTSYEFGDILGGGSAAKSQANAQSNLDYYEWVRNEASAKAQRAWEEYMSNTQVQRSMADLKAAGLNPWLAVQSAGFGQNVPSGASASSSAGQVAAGKGAGQSLMAMGTAAFGIAKLIQVVRRAIK